MQSCLHFVSDLSRFSVETITKRENVREQRERESDTNKVNGHIYPINSCLPHETTVQDIKASFMGKNETANNIRRTVARTHPFPHTHTHKIICNNN